MKEYLEWLISVVPTPTDLKPFEYVIGNNNVT